MAAGFPGFLPRWVKQRAGLRPRGYPDGQVNRPVAVVSQSGPRIYEPDGRSLLIEGIRDLLAWQPGSAPVET